MSPATSKLPADPILIVDDEAEALHLHVINLQSEGIKNVVTCSRGQQALEFLAKQTVAVLLLDLNMPEMSGQQVLDRVTKEYPEMPVVIMTGDDEVETAVDCMKRGAFDFAVKPMSKARLLTVVRRALEAYDLRLSTTLRSLREGSVPLKNPATFSAMITRDPSMLSLFTYVENIAVTTQPVLITGETGVGKELMARAVHKASGRTGEFVAVNVAGLDDTAFSDTLFGHKRGAFTGADKDRRGLIERAAGGTLFLDEIGDLSSSSQLKLLRLLQEREFYALGSDTPSSTDARVVVATNREPKDLLKSPQFRKDLYYRLHAHHVHVPALRKRRDDLPLLVEYFLKKSAKELKKNVPGMAPETMTRLASYPFPGNVRELNALLLDALSRHDTGKLTLVHFPTLNASGTVAGASATEATNTSPAEAPAGISTISDMEDRLIDDAVRATKGNLTQAAERLGISRQTLYRKMKQKGKAS